MSDLEQELRAQLQEFEVPRGFADRVVRRVEKRIGERHRWRGAVAAAIFVGIFLGGEGMQMHHKVEQRKEKVRQEFLVAMQVTNHSMNAVQRSLERLDKTKQKEVAE